jgi:DNA mismatch repair protein MutS
VRFIEELQNSYKKLIDNCVSYIKTLDFGSTNAYNSVHLNLNRPEIKGTSPSINAKQLRHPIIEHVQSNVGYIPNDISFDKNTRGRVIYGINSSGKSSLMKSVGIALLMAQSGMYVAAQSFVFYPYRSIFTRIMTGDNLFKGQSTFTSEMIQLRNILRFATHESLVIGDELCSGTESVSAVSLVSAGLISLSKRDVSFMFATHLHELTKIEEVTSLLNVKMNHLSVRYDSTTNDIIYERKLQDGPCETLYGLEVCKSLDLDPSFLECANKIRHSIMNEPKKLVPAFPSKYNKQVYKTKCKVCNRTAKDIHHIRFQKDADENGRIEHFHKNSKFNLVDLCERCHHEVHTNKLTIHSYSQTSSGIKLIFEHSSQVENDVII